MRLVLTVLALTSCLFQSGCLIAAAAAGTGATVAYVRGDLSETVVADPQRVALATEQAAKNMELVVVSKQSSKVDAKVVTRTARDVRMVVVAKSEGEQTSRVFVRVGTFGDDSLQRRMMDQIRANLTPTTNPTGAPAVTVDASK